MRCESGDRRRPRILLATAGNRPADSEGSHRHNPIFVRYDLVIAERELAVEIKNIPTLTAA
jgi:hypothetical protein